MSELDELKVFTPSFRYIDDGIEHGILSPFKPGTLHLKKGWQIDPRFKPLECDIILEKDVAVKMRDGITIYVDIYRPVTSEKVPVIIS